MALNTRILGQGIQTLANGSTVIITNKDRTQEMTQFTVANLETVASARIIYIGGTDKTEALPVFPQQVVTLETDSPFSIINNSGATISYVVGQLFANGITNRRANSASSGGSGSSTYSAPITTSRTPGLTKIN